MAIIGNNTAGTDTINYMADNLVLALWQHPATLTGPGIVTKLWFHGVAAFDEGPINIAIYKQGATVALTTLVDYAPITIPLTPEGWYSAEVSIILEAGIYIIAAVGDGNIAHKKATETANKSVTTTGHTPPATLTGAAELNKKFGLYAEYTEFEEEDFSDDLQGSFPVLIPVEPRPILTDGRYISPTWSEGHGPELALEENLNTYWEPEGYEDDALYFDLGEDIPLYAIGLWLHNYNEAWGSPKSWCVSFSLDDVNYVPLDEKLFDDYRDSQGPIVIDILSTAVSARYWKIDFLHFDEYPKTAKAQVSAVWFLIPKYLRTRRILPATDQISYGNERIEDAIKRIATRHQWYGSIRTMPMELILTSQADADVVETIYEAARYGARPIIAKPNASDTSWQLLHMSDLSIRRAEHGTWRAQFNLQDVGHKLIERYDFLYCQHPETVGLWQFNSSVNDSSGNGNHFTIDVGNHINYVYGLGGYEKSAMTLFDGTQTFLYILAVDAGDFDMGMDDFTIEMMFIITSVDGYNSWVFDKWTNSPALGFNMGLKHVTGELHLQFFLADGTHSITNMVATGKNLADGEWHYAVVTVDRTNNLVKLYVDTVQYGGDYDISTITGSVSNPTKDLALRFDHNMYSGVDFAAITKRVFTQAEIEERAIGSISYGTWRL